MTDISPLWISVKLAAVTTSLLLVISTPLAWWLARTQNRIKIIPEALFALPLVLPPTVLGFYLLLLLNPESVLGQAWFHITGNMLIFNFSGLVMGSLIYSLPFVLRPLQNAFESVSEGLLEAAATLKASPFDQFLSIGLPMARAGYLTAAVLGFAHTLGEFGVVLMLGGNIPGKTRTVSIAIYDSVEQIKYHDAHIMSAILLAAAFLMLIIVFACGSAVKGGKSV